MLTFGAGWCNIHLFAEMAELADAHGSGPCGSDTMRVQVPLSALQSGDHKIPNTTKAATFRSPPCDAERGT